MGELVYEMVWDCRYCGSRKLLGLTHRHCPTCGAQQDPNARYFPPDHEKVAVQNHELVGTDISCRYCAAPSSRKALHCGQCGGSLSEGTAVALQVAPSAHGMAYAASSPIGPPKRAWWKLALPVLCLAAVVVAVLLLLWKREQRFVVAERTWTRSVAIERLSSVREWVWCDELPEGTRELSRRREQRGTKQVPDGEDCELQRQDLGDGTFKETRVCRPRSKEAPVYSEKCELEMQKWARAREERAEGRLDSSEPHWPQVVLSRPRCESTGCEREGPRSERYAVLLKDAQGEPYRCDFDERTWRSFTPNARYAGQIRAALGSLDCSSLERLR
jgi:hypothetical protein